MDQSFMSPNVTSMKASAIREIFKMSGRADCISLAGGNPSPTLFPAEDLAEITSRILKEQPSAALLYGVTEGYVPLRDYVREEMRSRGIMHECDDVIITAGGQQAIDLCAKTLLCPGDVCVVEAPSFVGGLNAFRSFGAKLIGIPVKDDGLDIDALEELLSTTKIKMVYTIPTFQNPTGITMSIEKRTRLLDLAEKYDFYILEDDPYSKLRFSGEPVAEIKTMDESGRVIYAGSFSKIIAPGLRVGYACARKDILDRFTVCKQVSDVHTACLNQMAVFEYVTSGKLEGHIKDCQDYYRNNRQVMTDTIDKLFPDFCTRTSPEGGLFLWCTLPEGWDTQVLAADCAKKSVMFVPGSAAMVDLTRTYSEFRLNYSEPSPDKIKTGVGIIAEVLSRGK